MNLLLKNKPVSELSRYNTKEAPNLKEETSEHTNQVEHDT